jgi:hypothetical protein
VQNKTNIPYGTQTDINRTYPKPKIHIHTTENFFSKNETYTVISQNKEELIAEVGRLNVS